MSSVELVGLVFILYGMAALTFLGMLSRDDPPPRWLPLWTVFAALFVGLLLTITTAAVDKWNEPAVEPSHKTLVIEHGPCACECPGENP
jgi:hypothetical protein